MPRKGYVKPGSTQDKKKQKEFRIRTVEGLDKVYESILEQMELSKKPPNDEQIRFLKNYHKTRAEAIEKAQGTTEREVLPEGQLREWVEKYYKIHKVLQAADYPAGKEGIIKILEDASYYICDVCGYSHKLDEECPILLLAKELKVDLEQRPTNKQLDELL